MHISDMVKAHLVNNGWKDSTQNEKTIFKKLINFKELSGNFSNGNRMVTLEFDERCRYLSVVDGWGTVLMDCDMRGMNANNIADNIEMLISVSHA